MKLFSTIWLIMVAVQLQALDSRDLKIEQARQLINQQPTEAQDLLTALDDLTDHQDAKRKFYLGFIHYKKNQYNQALIYYLDALNHLQQSEQYDPFMEISLHKNISPILRKRGLFDLAADHTTAALNLLQAEKQNINTSQSLRDIQELGGTVTPIDTDQELASLHYNLAKIHYTADQLPDAVDHFIQSVYYGQTARDSARCFNYVALSLQKQGDHLEAIRYWKMNLSRSTRYQVQAHHNIANSLQAMSYPTDSVRYHFDKVLELSPDHFVTLMDLGELMIKTDDLAAAAQYLERAVAQYPDGSIDPIDFKLYTIIKELHKRTGDTARFFAADSTLTALVSEYTRNQSDYRAATEKQAITEVLQQYDQILINREKEKEHRLLVIIALIIGTALTALTLTWYHRHARRQKAASIRRNYQAIKQEFNIH